MPGRVQSSEPSGPHQHAGHRMVNPRTAMPSVRLQVDAKFTAPTWAAEATRRRVRIDWTAAADLRPLPTRLTSRGARRAAAWIRRRSRQLREECGAAGVPYVDVGELGFETAMRQARALFQARSLAQLLATPAPRSSLWLPDGYVQNFRQAA